MVDWTEEKIRALDDNSLKSLHDNAQRKAALDLEALCSAEITRRRPVRSSKAATSTRKADGVVGGYHFVCANSRGVTRNTDGTVWSGTWVVGESHLELSTKVGAYLALHESKAQRSYLQGRILTWRKSEREARYSEETEARTAYGIDFLIEETTEPYEWRGGGSGEKGYFWIPRETV